MIRFLIVIIRFIPCERTSPIQSNGPIDRVLLLPVTYPTQPTETHNIIITTMTVRYQDSPSPLLSLLQQKRHHHHHSYSYSCYRYSYSRCVTTATMMILLWIYYNKNTHYDYPVYMIHAWGRTGHEMVGNIASALLSDDTVQQIQILLNITATNVTTATTTTTSTNSRIATPMKTPNTTNGGDTDTDTCLEYCTPLAIVADWADQVRFYYKWSAPLHYIDVRDDIIVPRGCPVHQYMIMTTTTDTTRMTTTTDTNNNESTGSYRYTSHLIVF